MSPFHIMLRVMPVVLLAVLLGSCERIFIGQDPVSDPVSNFDVLWETLDERYSFFAFKGVDWDSVYRVYRPLVRDDMDEEELFLLMADMLHLLRDGHVNLRSDFDISKYLGYYLDYPQNFDFGLLERSYLQEDYRITGPLINQIIDSAGYIRYASFQSTVTEEQLDEVLGRFQGLRGLIIDIRDNEGGDPANGFRIIRRIADERRLVYYNRYKNGPGPDDFTEPEPTYLGPEGAVRWTGPVVLLTNRSCYSASSWFTVMAAPSRR